MKKHRFLFQTYLFLFSVLLSQATYLGAAEFGTDPGNKQLLMYGAIVNNDLEIFNEYVDNYEISEIQIKSLGGNFAVAYSIADKIVEKQLDVTIPDSGKCASACAIIFAAGAQRKMSKNATVGLHPPSLDFSRNDSGAYCRYLQSLKSKQEIQKIKNSNEFSEQEKLTRVDQLKKRTEISLGRRGFKQSTCLELTYQRAIFDYHKMNQFFAREGMSAVLMNIVATTPPSSMTWLNVTQALDLGLATDSAQ